MTSPEKKAGFMTGIGFLLSKADDDTKSSILKILEAAHIPSELEKEDHSSVAFEAGVHPCEPPFVWNPVTQYCE